MVADVEEFVQVQTFANNLKSDVLQMPIKVYSLDYMLHKGSQENIIHLCNCLIFILYYKLL